MLSNNGYGVKDKLLLVMTRNEEIQNYAYNNCINDDVDDTSYSLIVETAKWADETMIEKACKWLQKTLYIYTEINDDENWVTSDYNSIEEFIENFKESLKS